MTNKNMNTDLHKRFEEAASIEAINDTSKGRDRKDYFITAMADHENGFREGFLAGAEFGHKEAIKIAKEWLEEKIYDGKYWGRDDEGDFLDAGELLIDFESNMKKLWEEKK